MGAGGLEQGDDVNDDARLAIVIGDPTAITTVKGANEESVWYDLQGHRISGKPAARGIYIHNDKKVVVYE